MAAGPPNVAAEAGVTCAGSSFEALFVRALTVGPELEQQLLRAGFELKKVQANYPMEVWARCLELARAALFADLPRLQGFRQLGLRYWTGYRHTLLGKFVLSMAPMASVEGILKRMPRIYSMNRSRPLQMTVTKIAEREHRVDVPDRLVEPGFLWGSTEAGLKIVDSGVQVEMVNELLGHVQLRVTW